MTSSLIRGRLAAELPVMVRGGGETSSGVSCCCAGGSQAHRPCIAILYHHHLLLPLLVVSSCYRPLLRKTSAEHSFAQAEPRPKGFVVVVADVVVAPSLVVVVAPSCGASSASLPTVSAPVRARPAPTTAAWPRVRVPCRRGGGPPTAAAKPLPLASGPVPGSPSTPPSKRFFREPLPLARAGTMGSTCVWRASGSRSGAGSPSVVAPP